ncbi:MAG: gamma-glutamylcyclotransferase family protein [Flavitalea sp.]
MEPGTIAETFNRLISKYNHADEALRQADSALQSLIAAHSPFNRLVVYGSLAPGCINHEQVQDIEGEWNPVRISGTLENAGWGSGAGYPGFRFVEESSASVIPAQLFESPALPEHWERLDEFEGEEYRRVLIVFQLGDSEGLGFIYALA